MKFYLGTHMASWLEKTDVPLFLSIRALRKRKKLPVAKGPYCADSGGFTELNLFGEWRTSASQFIEEVRRIAEHVGRPDWVPNRDWMCESFVLQKTGLTVAEHQRRTVEDFIDLKSRAPDLPWMPVLQGFTLDEYLACAELYERQGVQLRAEKIVGVGTMCRRQGTQDAHKILHAIQQLGIKSHAFGFKKTGLQLSRQFIASSDSLAWSLHARKNPYLSCGGEHRKKAKSCANCLPFALRWRSELLRELSAQDQQLSLWAA